jgi:hypothetical protein
MLGRAEELFRELRTREAITALIGQSEDAHFDCKEWPENDGDAQRMLAKATCGLTNAEGGVLVIGMKARAMSKEEPDVVESAAPVDDTSQVKSRVLSLIGNLVEPGVVGVDAAEVRLNEASMSGFVVVYVAASEGKPRRSRKDWKFYQRIGSGTFPMEYFQIEERFGERPPPKLELYLEFETIKRSVYSLNPVRHFMLGLRNTGSGIAKFPSIRFKRTCGLTVDNFGIDGNHGFGISPRPSESESISFRGGIDEVIFPGETLMIAKLLQDGESRGTAPGSSSKLWRFGERKFSCELSCDGAETRTVEKTIAEEMYSW